MLDIDMAWICLMAGGHVNIFWQYREWYQDKNVNDIVTMVAIGHRA